MSVTTSTMRNTQVITSNTPQAKNGGNNTNEHNTISNNKKIKKEDSTVPVVKTNADTTSMTSSSTVHQNGSTNNYSTTTTNQSYTSNNPNYPSGNPNMTNSNPNQQQSTEMDYSQNPVTTSLTNTVNGSINTNGTFTYNMNIGMNGLSNGLSNGYHPQSYSTATNGMNGMTGNSLDPTGPLPNEIFELLNEFWRPNDLVGLENHMTNGKFSRRSPEGSLEDTQEDEKDGEDDLTSIADADTGVDRNTQKRRYSRLSDGYERLKSVLPSVKDKRRVSKARILDEAINYIQRLESITNVLKREHEKRLSMLNGSNGFFTDYSMQPYMRSLFQKQMYPPSGKMGQYPKMSTTQSTIPKSPRIKQQQQQQQYNHYNSQQTTNGMSVASHMTPTDYNYNNINSTYNSTSMYAASSEMMNGDTSPIPNNSPYSACSLSPGSTPTTYQSNNVNNSWPYQGNTNMTGYTDANTSQLSSYQNTQQNSRQNSTTNNGSTTAYGGSTYTNLNGGGGNMWGSMSLNETNNTSSQISQHNTDHAMKVA